jgi:inorganic triphosphatase YgiF
MGREFELKYSCSAEDFEALKAAYEGFTTIEMETTYYDTFDAKLNNRHWTLRRRYENGLSVCTLKTPDPTGGRSEWEVEAPGIITAIPMLCRMGAPMELMALTVSGLQEVCGAKFTRLALQLEVPGAKVELALDKGKLFGGGREKALQEVEVELKDGADNAAIAFARLLEEKYHLTPEKRSKYNRALGLAMGE